MILIKKSFKTNIYNWCKRDGLALSAVILLLFMQILFWNRIKNLHPFLEIVPTPPNSSTIKAMSFGDSQTLFRLKGYEIQNSGDTFGRFTPLKNYDYKKLYQWLINLDELDVKSNFLASLAAYYYSQTQRTEDSRYIIDFLEQHALRDMEKKWWWLYQAMYIANYSLKDRDRALDLADKLIRLSPDSAPLWTKQMKAILLSKYGDDCEAVRVMGEIIYDLEHNSSKTQEEKVVEFSFMKHFLDKRREVLDAKGFDASQCQFNRIINE